MSKNNPLIADKISARHSQKLLGEGYRKIPLGQRDHKGNPIQLNFDVSGGEGSEVDLNVSLGSSVVVGLIGAFILYAYLYR